MDATCVPADTPLSRAREPRHHSPPPPCPGQAASQQEDVYESLPDTVPITTHMMAGSMAGVMEHSIMFPIDTVKTRMQSLQPNPKAQYKNVFEGLLRIMHTEGVAGGLATLVHDGVMTPAEAVKQRMQMFNSPYRGVWHCVRVVRTVEGPRAFYRSYTTQLTMNVPFQAIHFMAYEFLQEQLNPCRRYNPSSHMVAGALAGAVAATATTPLDVCKTLLNTQENLKLGSLGLRNRRLSGMASALWAVYRIGGLPAYFKGAQARVVYQMPSTAICWSVYEFFKYFITKQQQQARPPLP